MLGEDNVMPDGVSIRAFLRALHSDIRHQQYLPMFYRRGRTDVSNSGGENGGRLEVCGSQ